MKITTSLFEEDKATVLIRCNAKKTGKKAYRVKAVLLASEESKWTNTYRYEVEAYVRFRTVFKLWLSKTHYLLQIIGESDNSAVFPNRYKVVTFVEPSECIQIVNDSTDSRLYMSDPLLSFFDKLQCSEYLTDWERENWFNSLIEDE